MYTGVGDDGRQHLELTSVTVVVQIDERIARTRTDQIFTNHAEWEVEGIYEFTLPEGAIITDLVLWIGDKRIQGMVLEKEEARRTYDDIVGRRIDPALIEQVTPNQFRLSIFPFPAQGSRRVEFEYMQLLESRNGRLDYSFPLAPETDQPCKWSCSCCGHRCAASTLLRRRSRGCRGSPRSTDPTRTTPTSSSVTSRVKPREDFTLTIRQTDDRPKPTVLSFAPQPNDDLGYYALWLPPLPELTQGEPLPRSLTFVIDISSRMQQGKLQAVKGALITAIDGLDAADLFNIVVFTHRADSFAAAPVPADPANKKAATASINQQDALGVSNFEAGLGRAMQQAFPANRVNHVIFLTDGLPTLGELDLALLSEMVGEWSAGQARLFTIGVGQDVDQGFLIGLAEEHRGKAYFLSEEGDIEAALQELFESFTFPVLLLDELSFDQVEIHDVHPRGVEALAAGRELFQVGRYRDGGTFTLSLTGHVGADESVSVDFPLEFTQTDVSGNLIPRLWAYQKIQALEEQIARFGEQQELLDGILTLGLDYRLVTRRTSLFAPDDGVEVNPLPRFFDDFVTTDINDARPTTHWLGRDFALEDEVWIDLTYQPGMPKELYRRPHLSARRASQLCPVGPSHASGGGRAGLRDPRKRPGQQAGTPAERPQPLQRLHGDLLPDTVPPGERGDPPEHLQLNGPARARNTV